MRWVKIRSRHFRGYFFQRALDIKNEFAQLHIRDQELDDFFQYTGIADTLILPQTIESVAQRIKVLADKI